MIAKYYHALGFNVLKLYGSNPDRPQNKSPKAPMGQWKQWTDARQTNEEFAQLAIGEDDVIGIVTGFGTEVIDIDSYDEKVHDRLIASSKAKIKQHGINPEELYKKIVVQQTGSGGLHLIYRCTNPEGNRKLWNDSDGKCIVETRGKGGQIVIAPSSFLDLNTGELKSYKLIKGSLSSMEVLTDRERIVLVESFTNIRKEPPKENYNSSTGTDVDSYDLAGDEKSLLEKHGWKLIYENGPYDQYTRPGTSSGDNHAGWHRDKRFFHVFTTNDHILESNRGYTLTQLLCRLEFNNDFIATVRHLSGSKPVEVPKIIKDYSSLRIRSTDPIEVEQYAIASVVNGRRYNLAAEGNIGVFSGYAKSRKTAIAKGMAAAAINGTEETVLNWDVQLAGKKVLWFDTEQAKFRVQWGVRDIYNMAKKNYREDNHNFRTYGLRGLKDPKERFLYADKIIKDTDNIGLIMIDGIVDLIRNYNDQEECRDVLDWVMWVTDERKCVFTTVLHLAQSTGNLRGHIGTELRNKCDFAVTATKVGPGEFDPTEVDCVLSRDLCFPKFEIVHNSNKEIVLMEDFSNERINQGFVKKGEREPQVPFYDPSIKPNARPNDFGALFP